MNMAFLELLRLQRTLWNCNFCRHVLGLESHTDSSTVADNEFNARLLFIDNERTFAALRSLHGEGHCLPFFQLFPE
jgi:hypothetical protein